MGREDCREVFTVHQNVDTAVNDCRKDISRRVLGLGRLPLMPVGLIIYGMMNEMSKKNRMR